MGMPSSTQPIIFANEGPLKGQTWTLANDIVIGRDITCDITIPDRQVSRRHAQIKISDGGSVEVVDLDSKNGIYVNGERIVGTAVLNDGDAIKIALIQEIIYVSSDATIPLQVSDPDADSTPKLFLDENARRVWIGDEELLPPLSVSQYKLLTLLYYSQDRAVTREQIISEVWGVDAAVGVSDQALDALVRRLRERLHKKDPTHEYISTIRGVGFMFKNILYKD